MPRVRDAVRAVAARMPVIVATGRMYRSALFWAVELGVVEPLVCYQGAMVREMPRPDGSPGSTIFEQPLRAAPRSPRAAHRPRAGLALPGVPGRRAALRAGSPRGTPVLAHQRRAVPRCSRPRSTARARHDQGRVRHRGSRRGGSRKRPDGTQSSPGAHGHPLEPRVRRDPRSRGQQGDRMRDRVRAPRVVTLADAVAVGDAPNDIELLPAPDTLWPSRRRAPRCSPRGRRLRAPEDGGVADVLEALGLR